MSTSRRQFLFQSIAGSALAAGTGSSAAQALDSTIIGGNTWVLGYSLLQSIELMQELGFQTVEIHPFGVPDAIPGRPPGFQFDRLSDDKKRKIKSALAGFRHVTSHLPYTDLHYLSLSAPVAEFAVKQIDIALEATAYFGGEVAVLHPEPASGQTLEQVWPVMLRRFRRWGDMARKAGIRIGLETGHPPSVRDFVRLVQAVDHDNVGATIDVGHQSKYAELVSRVRPDERGTPKGIKAYNDTTIDIIDRLRSKVIHFHVHDIEPASWKEHQPLIHGFVDYPRLIKKLREIEYNGVLVIEIGAPADEMPRHLSDAKRKLEGYLSGASTAREAGSVHGGLLGGEIAGGLGCD